MTERSEKTYGEWEEERRAEIREKHLRGEELSHAEKLSLAIDTVEDGS